MSGLIWAFLPVIVVAEVARGTLGGRDVGLGTRVAGFATSPLGWLFFVLLFLLGLILMVGSLRWLFGGRRPHKSRGSDRE